MKAIPSVILLMLGFLVAAALAIAGGSSYRFAEIWGHYEAIRVALVNDSTASVADHAGRLSAQASSLRHDLTAEAVGVSAQDLEARAAALTEIEESAARLRAASDLETAREEFFVLTRPMAKYRKLSGDEATIVAYCSMAQKAWLQPEGELGNPYMGQSMPRCGEVVGE